jgi:hypothetical protein
MTDTIEKLSVEQSKAIAGEILKQLGGHQFLVMTGSVPQYCDNYTSAYKLRRNKSGANYMKITLNCMDTYDIDFIFCSAKGIKTLVEKRGYYNDMLPAMFTEVTGLNTQL